MLIQLYLHLVKLIGHLSRKDDGILAWNPFYDVWAVYKNIRVNDVVILLAGNNLFLGALELR